MAIAFGDAMTSTVGASGGGMDAPVSRFALSSGADSNVVFRDATGKILTHPALLKNIATIDVYYV